MSNEKTRHFLTVEWCNNGRRGIFCSATGIPYAKDTPLTTDEMNTYLDPFFIILAPKSIELSEQELSEYHLFIPLAEYSEAFGIVYKASN